MQHRGRPSFEGRAARGHLRMTDRERLHQHHEIRLKRPVATRAPAWSAAPRPRPAASAPAARNPADRVSPSASRSAPAQAIIAPLSVQSSAGGTTSLMPPSNATRCSTLRIASLAATPPAATSAVGAPIARAEHLHAGAQPIVDQLHHRLLERRAQISHVLVGERRDPLGLDPQRGLQPRQRKIRLRPPVHRPRQREPRRVAPRRLLLHLRPAGIAQPQKLCGLVERLADRVVRRGAEQRVVADALHRDDLGVAAGRQEQAIREQHARGQPRRRRRRGPATRRRAPT